MSQKPARYRSFVVCIRCVLANCRATDEIAMSLSVCFVSLQSV